MKWFETTFGVWKGQENSYAAQLAGMLSLAMVTAAERIEQRNSSEG